MFPAALLLVLAQAPAPKVYRYTVAERQRILLVQPPLGVSYHLRISPQFKLKRKPPEPPRIELLRRRQQI